MDVYSIRDWDYHFECAQSRKVTGPLTWFPMPTKHDGKSFRRIMARMDGPMIYAAWCLIVGVAAKARVRGLLADTDGPLTAEDLAIKTGCAAEHFETALKVLSSKEIGWLVVAEWEQSGATGQDKQTEQDKKGCCASSAEPARSGQPAAATVLPMSEFVFPTAGNAKQWALPQAKLEEYLVAYPGVDVPAEMRKARQWCRDNSRQRKTPGGMQPFLTRWLNKAQDWAKKHPQDDADANRAARQRAAQRQHEEFAREKEEAEREKANGKTETAAEIAKRLGAKIRLK
jgi:hypothetical protein